MTLETVLAIIAGVLVVLGLLFLSMIHLFMIPKDVMKRDTTRQSHLEGNRHMPLDSAQRDKESPEIPQDPNEKPDPEIKENPRPEREVERKPGQKRDDEPEKEPDSRKQ